jgi:hypothetical protein
MLMPRQQKHSAGRTDKPLAVFVMRVVVVKILPR